MKYKAGDVFTTAYTNPPVSRKQQYAIGSIVDITDEETGEEIGYFRVLESDPRRVTGMVVDIALPTDLPAAWQERIEQVKDFAKSLVSENCKRVIITTPFEAPLVIVFGTYGSISPRRWFHYNVAVHLPSFDDPEELKYICANHRECFEQQYECLYRLIAALCVICI